MRIVFMGTPDFAASILDELKEQHEIVAVYTQPDAIRNRGKTPAPSPVKKIALSAGIKVYEPRSLLDPEETERLCALNPRMICVAAYGKILPQEILDIPALGCLNVHASLLPKYRGAAPVERAILAGEKRTGVCIMRMEAGVDTGECCVFRSCDIGDMTCERLTAELAEKGARALLFAICAAERGEIRWIPQDESQATYAPKLQKGELNCSPDDPATTNLRRVQASGSAHPSKCLIGGRGVTLIEARPAINHTPGNERFAEVRPGQALLREKHLLLGCADRPFEVVRLKPDGKKEMSAAAFASGVQEIKTGNVMWERL